jgi:hypothetical protein
MPDDEPEFRNTALSDALQTQDLAAVAFALRHGPTVVPLATTDAATTGPDTGEVFTYRDPNTRQTVLLLFSDAARVPASLPSALGLNTPAWLRAFLGVHEDDIATVFFDVAGPHPMQATPRDLIAALDA